MTEPATHAPPARPGAQSARAAAKGSFRLAPYFQSLSYLTLLLGAGLIALPRSSDFFSSAPSPAAQRSSRDRPEPAWLTPITANPTHTLAWEVAGLVVTMGWWSRKMAALWGVSPGAERLKETIATTLGAAAFFHLALVLLGAPIASRAADTALLATHLALLAATPIVYALGVPSIHDDGIAARYRLTRIVCQWAPETAAERALTAGLAGTLVGAWVGALPLALDWDRPWQAYPLTPMVGSLVGFVVAGYASWAISAYASLGADVSKYVEATAPKPKAPAAAPKKRKGKAQ
ncbi:Glycosylphosphatidylinositol (GPI) anchor assembly protein [Vanrija albida]|uniref:Glycosylphosphatidylinositol (GPI) anchor assembly protein n=1 Tax=Vanrija albida TaxID=181172 RepID=A0ABR3QE01_9TREE